MSTQSVLSDTVFVAATLCPRILRSVIKAKYGSPAEKRLRLQEAKGFLLALTDKVEVAEAAVTAESARAEEAAS